MQGEILPPIGAPAKLIHIPNPLAPELGVRIIECDAGDTVCGVIERENLRLRYSTVLCRGGELVRRAEWNHTPIRPGETLTLITVPQGGGNGGSQIGQILLAVVLAVLTVYTYGATSELLAADLGSTGASLAGAVAAAAVSIGGQYLISALIGHPKKSQITGPDYALFNQSNSARIGFPIPEIFGRFMTYPNLASVPYSDWADNRQHIYQLFSLGKGDYDVEQIRISQTIVWKDGAVTGSYPDLQIQIVPPGGTVTLFPGNVYSSTEVQSIELKGTNEVGAGWFGPFAASLPGIQVSQIVLDLALPGGLFDTSSSGQIQSVEADFTFQAQLIDDSGSAIGPWLTILDQHWKMATRDAQYVTRICDVPVGRYQIRGERTNVRKTVVDGTAVDLLIWSGMRSFQPVSQIYGDVTVIAVRAAPTNGLNATSASQFNVIATRKLPIYDTGTKTWSASVATRSISAAAAYLCKSDNGGNLPDSRIDLDLLFGSLETTWTARGDNFDGVFETRASFWESLQIVLKCGRTVPILAGQTISFVRDEQKLIHRTGFSPGNMIADSFQIDYLHYDSNTADAVWIEFMDARVWQKNTVFCGLPDFAGDVNDPRIPTLKWEGITDRSQAWREGIHLVASNRWRRAFPSFRTEWDGRVCFRGDLISVSHWLPQWGSSMNVLDLTQDMAGDILTMSEPWQPPAGFEDFEPLVILMTPDGKVYGPVQFGLLDNGSATRQAKIRLLTVVDPGGTYAGQQPRDWPVWSGDGLQHERTKATLGVAERMTVDALVVSMKPERGATATVVAVTDDTRVYEADTPDPPTENVPSALPVEDLTITALKIQRITPYGDNSVNYTTGAGSQDILVSITGAPNAIWFEAQWKWSDATDYGTVTTLEGATRTFEFPAEDEDLSLQVRAKGNYGWGPWFSAFTLQGSDGTGASGSGSGGGIVGGGGIDFFSIIGRAGLASHCQMCWDAGSSDSYGGAGQTITDISGNGMHFHLGATGAAEASDPVFHGSAGGLSASEYFTFGAARGSGDFSTGGSGEWLTLAAANPAWVNALHQGPGKFTVAALIYFPGHPAVITPTGTDFAWISPFATTDGVLQHEGVSVEWYSEAQTVAGTIYYTSIIQANVNRSAGADAEASGYGWYATSTTPTPAGWYFVLQSVDQISGNTVLFINNITATSPGIGPSGGTDASAADLTLCTGGANSSVYNGARIAMTAAWDVALTGAEAANLYAQVQQYRADFGLP